VRLISWRKIVTQEKGFFGYFCSRAKVTPAERLKEKYYSFLQKNDYNFKTITTVSQKHNLEIAKTAIFHLFSFSFGYTEVTYFLLLGNLIRPPKKI